MDCNHTEIQNMDRMEYKRVVFLSVTFLITILLGFFLIGNDFELVIRFWVAIFLLGVSVLPVTFYIFKEFKNAGYLFSKIIGLTLCSYFLWLFSSLHILKFHTSTCILSIVTIAALSYLPIAIKKKNLNSFYNQIKEKWFYILLSEFAFLLLFILFIYLLGNKIPGTETEKGMDYALLSVLSRTEFMPPLDMWAAGNTLNYYYFGQYLITYITKVSFIDVRYGYSLGMAVIATFCFLLVVSLVYEIMRNKLDDKNYKSDKAAIVASLLSGIAVTFAGNMHYIIFGKIVPILWDILQIQGEKPAYWFASSTRYIGYIPDVANDKTITEFPCYSFLIGDLHAHVIDIIIVLTILAILFSYMKRNKERGTVSDSSFIKELLQPHLLMIAFLIGICSMTSYWDYPIYYVISGSIVLAVNVIRHGFKRSAIFTTLGQGMGILCVIKLISLPFTLKFNAMIMGIGLCTTHSSFYQLLILWGFPVVMVLYFIYVITKKLKDGNQRRSKISELFAKIGESDLFIILIGLCAIGLIIMPEIIYVRDIYENGFPRANTMFKLTYAAFILFGIVLGYILARLLYFSDNYRQKKAGVIGLICLILTTLYFFSAAKMWLGDYWLKKNFKGIDASSYFNEKLPDDMNAIKWLQENVKEDNVVLEADGDSYTDYQRVSMLTGLPTVLGWHTHEWLWNNGYSIVEERQADITELYTGSAVEEKEDLIDKYNINYIFIGTKEYEKYSEMDVSSMKKLGEVVFSEYHSESNQSTFIVKVK